MSTLLLSLLVALVSLSAANGNTTVIADTNSTQTPPTPSLVQDSVTTAQQLMEDIPACLLDPSVIVATLLLAVGYVSFIGALVRLRLQRVSGACHNMDNFYDAGGHVDMYLCAVAVAGQMWWPLQAGRSAASVVKYGISGAFWCALGPILSVMLFPVLTHTIRTKAPGAKTFLQVFHVRFGRGIHLTFCVISLVVSFVVMTTVLSAGVSFMQILICDLGATNCMLILLLLCTVAPCIGGLGGTFYLKFHCISAIFVITTVFIIVALVDNTMENGLGNFYDTIEKRSLSFTNPSAVQLGCWEAIVYMSYTFLSQSTWQCRIACSTDTGLLGYLLGALLWFTLTFTLGTLIGLVQLYQISSGGQVISEKLLDDGLLPIIMFEHYGQWGTVAILVAMVMSVMSTVSGEIMAVTSILVIDVYQTYFRPASIPGLEKNICQFCKKITKENRIQSVPLSIESSSDISVQRDEGSSRVQNDKGSSRVVFEDSTTRQNKNTNSKDKWTKPRTMIRAVGSTPKQKQKPKQPRFKDYSGVKYGSAVDQMLVPNTPGVDEEDTTTTKEDSIQDIPFTEPEPAEEPPPPPPPPLEDVCVCPPVTSCRACERDIVHYQETCRGEWTCPHHHAARDYQDHMHLVSRFAVVMVSLLLLLITLLLSCCTKTMTGEFRHGVQVLLAPAVPAVLIGVGMRKVVYTSVLFGYIAGVVFGCAADLVAAFIIYSGVWPSLLHQPGPVSCGICVGVAVSSLVISNIIYVTDFSKVDRVGERRKLRGIGNPLYPCTTGGTSSVCRELGAIKSNYRFDVNKLPLVALIGTLVLLVFIIIISVLMQDSDVAFYFYLFLTFGVCLSIFFYSLCMVARGMIIAGLVCCVELRRGAESCNRKFRDSNKSSEKQEVKGQDSAKSSLWKWWGKH